LTNFNDNLKIDFTKSLYIKNDVHNKMLKRSQLQNGDILFGIAGSIGKIAIFDKNIEANINQAIATLRFKEDINKLFIAYVLNSSIIKLQTARLQRPVAQPNLNTEELKSLKISLPPIEIQNKIADHIQNLRDKAQALKNEAIQIFEDVKQEVERMILNKNKKC
jgi:restriction endonuclease S subunit